MKHNRATARTLALVLALTLAFSLTSLPAWAADPASGGSAIRTPYVNETVQIINNGVDTYVRIGSQDINADHTAANINRVDVTYTRAQPASGDNPAIPATVKPHSLAVRIVSSILR